jgi:hypothetical protein
MNNLRIVVDGRERLNEATAQARDAKVRAMYAHELAKAGFWRGLYLECRIRMEARREARASKASLF